MSHYTSVYSAIATNLSPATLQADLAAIPLDTDTQALLGLSVESDHTTSSGNVVTRTIVLKDVESPAGKPIPPGATLGPMLQGFYTATFARALGTGVSTIPVLVT
jgi:hypothetical protein